LPRNAIRQNGGGITFSIRRRVTTSSPSVVVAGGAFVDLLLPDAARMHVCLVREVHQVVDHQPVIALDVVQAAAVRPLGMPGPGAMMDRRGVRLRAVARPDPHEAMALDDRKRPYRRKSAHALQRHRDRLAIRAHLEPVIAAHQPAFHDAPERQRRAAMRAPVLDRRDAAFRTAKEHDALAADLPAERPVVDLVRRAGDVPGVRGEHGAGSWSLLHELPGSFTFSIVANSTLHSLPFTGSTLRM
jgi:hypothetical protein